MLIGDRQVPEAKYSLDLQRNTAAGAGGKGILCDVSMGLS
jgi:hypothetical protein